MTNKNNLTKVLILSTTLFTALSAFGVPRLDREVDLRAPDMGRLLSAFRENGSCTQWSFLPGRLVASGKFLHETGVSSVKLNNQSYPSYLTTLQMTASSGATNNDIQALKNEILNSLNHDPECAGKVHSVNELTLNAAWVQSSNSFNPIISANRTTYGSIAPTYDTPAEDIIDIMAPQAITYALDGSAGPAINRMKDLLNGPANIGKFTYLLNGIVAQVDSRLNISGEVLAKFASAVKLISCDESHHSSSLFGDMVGGVASGLAGVNVKQDNKSCHFELVPPSYMGGKLATTIGIDHSRSTLDMVDSETKQKVPIMITPCDEKGHCGTAVTLEQFLNFKILELLLKSRFEVEQQNMINATYALTLGKNGTVDTAMSAEVSYKRMVEDKIGFGIPVYVVNPDPGSFDFGFTATKLYQCISSHFPQQYLNFQQYAGSQPVPIATECVK